MFHDGDIWCAMIGPDICQGCAGFGDTNLAKWAAGGRVTEFQSANQVEESPEIARLCYFGARASLDVRHYPPPTLVLRQIETAPL